MALTTVEVKRYECDACGKVVMIETEDDLLGITGTAYESTAEAGGGADWFACQRKCVGRAVAHALDKAWEEH